MPSPIAHLGAGYAMYRYYRRKLPQESERFRKSALPALFVMGLSLLPDLDIVPAIIYRDLHTYHNNFSHSLFLGIPAAVLIAAIFCRICHSDFWLWFLVCLISYDLHILMDLLTAERGVMLFWPLSQNRFVSPVRIFYGLKWGLGWFSLSHLWTMLTESVFVSVLVLILNYFDRRKNPPNHIPA